MKNILLSLIVAPYLLLAANSNSLLQATEPDKKNDVQNVEKGFEFYGGEKPSKDNVKDTLMILQYLKEIRDENKEQTKIQREILSLLERKMDPKPKEFVNANGKKCVANSSPDCFDYASLIENNPEVIKIPALKEFLSNPYDMNKAANYLKWQNQLMNHSFNTGNALQMASEQWGDSVNTLGATRSTYNSLGGVANAKLIPAAKEKYFSELSNLIEINIYIGMNNNLDIFAISGIADTLIQFPNLNYKFTFLNEYAKVLFEDGMNTLYSNKILAWNKAKKEVSEKSFKDADIYITPSLTASHKENGKIKVQTIVTGKFSSSVFGERLYNYLEYNKLIDYSKLSDTNIWNGPEGEKQTKEFYHKNFGVDIKTNVKEINNVKSK